MLVPLYHFKIILTPVLRIRDVYPESRIQIFPSRIPIKEVKYFNPEKIFLSSRKYDPGCSSRILIFFTPSGSRIQGSKRHRIRNTGIYLQRTECEERGAAVPHVRRAPPRAPHLALRGSALTPPSPPLSGYQAIQVTTHIQCTFFIRLKSKVPLFKNCFIYNKQGVLATIWIKYINKKCFDFLKTQESAFSFLFFGGGGGGRVRPSNFFIFVDGWKTILSLRT